MAILKAIPSTPADTTTRTHFHSLFSFICFLSVKPQESISTPLPSLNQEAAWYPRDLLSFRKQNKNRNGITC